MPSSRWTTAVTFWLVEPETRLGGGGSFDEEPHGRVLVGGDGGQRRGCVG